MARALLACGVGRRRQGRALAAQPSGVALRATGLRHDRRGAGGAEHALQGPRAVLYPQPVRLSPRSSSPITSGPSTSSRRWARCCRASRARSRPTSGRRFPKLRRVVVDADDPYPGCLRLDDVLEARRGARGATRASTSARGKPAPTIRGPSRLPLGTTSFPKGALISHRNAGAARLVRGQRPSRHRGRTACCTHSRSRRHLGRPLHPALDLRPRCLLSCSWRLRARGRRFPHGAGGHHHLERGRRHGHRRARSSGSSRAASASTLRTAASV